MFRELGRPCGRFCKSRSYQAKATVVIDNPTPGGLDKDKSFYPDNSPEYFQTHFELMKSHFVLQRTARLLDLAERPEYQPKPSAIKQFLKSLLPDSVLAFVRRLPKKKHVDSVDDAEEALIKQFAQDIEIMPIRGARLAHVTANAIDPELAAQIANTLGVGLHRAESGTQHQFQGAGRTVVHRTPRRVAAKGAKLPAGTCICFARSMGC
jgi:succinoglycan biosynthesis transport protein ExoP